MKKLVSMLLALAMVLTLAGGAMAETKDYSGYTIRIYSNSNSTERVNWLLNAAKEAGFSISIDDNSVISGDNAAIQKANESKDGDIIFGLNETRWSQLVNGTYENLDAVLGGRSRQVRLPRQGVWPRRAERADALPQ